MKLFAIAIVFVGCLGSTLVAAGEGPAPKRRVFVLHAGIHTIVSHPHKNIAAEQLQRGLAQRGVAMKDLIVLDNPFPTASWGDVLPWDAVIMYLDSMVPESRFAQQTYLRMHKALAEHGVKTTDDVVWVGHSAGGQVGLTMAHLASRVDQFPALAKAAQSYRFDMVILMGTPMGENPLPANVKLRTYYSPQDTTVWLAARYAPMTLFSLGLPVPPLRRAPLCPNGACVVRCFPGIQHHFWNTDERVLDCILGEFQADYCSRWQTPAPLPHEGLALAQLLARAVAEDCHVSLEDLPRRR